MPTALRLRPTTETRVVINVHRHWSSPNPERMRSEAQGIINDLPRSLERDATVEQDHEWTDGTSTYASLYDALLDTCDDDDADWPSYSVKYKSNKNDDIYTVRSSLTFSALCELAFRHPWDFTVTNARPALTDGQVKFIEHAKNCGLATFNK